MGNHQTTVFRYYGARREVLAQIASCYQQATSLQKTLLRDQAVELTDYGCKYILRPQFCIIKRAGETSDLRRENSYSHSTLENCSIH